MLATNASHACGLLLTVILSAQRGLQPPSMASHSDVGGSFLGKQLQRGSLIRSHAKIVGSSRYLRPAAQHHSFTVMHAWRLPGGRCAWPLATVWVDLLCAHARCQPLALCMVAVFVQRFAICLLIYPASCKLIS